MKADRWSQLSSTTAGSRLFISIQKLQFLPQTLILKELLEFSSSSSNTQQLSTASAPGGSRSSWISQFQFQQFSTAVYDVRASLFSFTSAQFQFSQPSSIIRTSVPQNSGSIIMNLGSTGSSSTHKGLSNSVPRK